MNKIALLLIFVLNAAFITALYGGQPMDPDTVSFEQQRQRVNTLLEERSKRFGDYNSSLQKKTGIFGIFKTKADMQRSIDILQQIVLTDNNIFVETKKLLDIKDFESSRNKALAAEYDQQVSAYMKTITKLQLENERLRAQIAGMDEEDHANHLWTYLLLAIVFVLLIVVYTLYTNHRKLRHNLQKP
ncbi:hypothetical protein BC792_101141 [Sphingobacterium allocomposti]|jgi:hypothetical protein|uniref:Uncharacterized protein n=1 Tax=Sphingobacterium allocomposti TaxID=415956 RepID=A0A5S5DS19_9SPHI|nr:hypothetical protein [Sphingobacterium composti Yoo et al. 2007 non Ten et al. 2007]TYP98484.1 hypothetical protein BC792_101141 [Sphingobacterium composti Yoo et al. 2007 non Ten et al. 2007]HLS95519.1 hypothetical protein [Sphingobacterium sp.]